MKGIFISWEQLNALTEWAERQRMEAEALLAEINADNQADSGTPYLARKRFKPVVCGELAEHLK